MNRHHPSPSLGRWVAGALLVFPLAGGAWLLAAQLPVVVEGWQSRSWPHATATVEHAAAEHRYGAAPSFRSGGNATHVVELRYRFEVAGRVHTGTRIGLDDEGKIQAEAGAQRLVARYPPGRRVEAWYAPDDPSRSLLEPGVPVGGVMACGFGLLLLALGALPLVGMWRRRRALQRWRAYR